MINSENSFLKLSNSFHLKRPSQRITRNMRNVISLKGYKEKIFLRRHGKCLSKP
jgi:hypothetical protein